MSSEEQVQIPPDAIASEEAIAVAVGALERMHGHHLADMNADEQAEARAQWRRQAEEMLAAVRGLFAEPAAGTGRAVIWFSDAPDGRVLMSATFQPQLEEVAGGEEFTGTPAQLRALQAFSAVSGEGGPVQPGG